MAVDSFLLTDSLISDGSIYLKVLVPSVAAGAIIGKGGETIAQVQKEVNARIKMSKANDFYPGISPPILLIRRVPLKAYPLLLLFFYRYNRESLFDQGNYRECDVHADIYLWENKR